MPLLVSKRFLGEEQRSIFLLFEVNIRVVFQLLQGELFGIDHRVARRQGNTRRRLNELHELNASLRKRRFQVVCGARGFNQHAQLAFAIRHVVNHAARRAVAERVIVCLSAIA